MNKENGRPQVTSFKDYRLYLKSLFEWSKQNKKSFSYEYCAKKLLTSKSYLKQVLDRKIHVDLNRATKVSKLFGMNAFEKQYFLVLILENQVSEPDLKRHFSSVLDRLRLNEELADLKAYRARVKEGSVQLPDWLSQTISSMTALKDFQLDAEWIHGKLDSTISLAEVEAGLKRVQKSKMIFFDGKRYRETETHHSPDPFEIDGHKRYIYGALKTIDILNGDFDKHRPALFFNGALPIHEKDYEKVAAAFYKLNQELIAISESSEDPNRIIFVSDNIFHVVK